MAGRILIVDDDEGFSRALARSLRRSGHDVSVGATGDDARKIFPETDADVVVLDYQLPDADGLALLDEFRPQANGAIFLMASAYPDLDVAVEAMRRGAFDYVAKGRDLEECVMRIERGADMAMLRRRMAEASRVGSDDDRDYGLIGESAPMRALRHRLDALAGADDTTVLIVGETGTGKGVVARAIHSNSGRAYEPFVAVDCTTIPATLVESELFGHEKGAFSGATGTKTGRVEAAGRGTLFLDEIGELELPVQAKLLRLLEEREFTRLGGTRTRNVEGRIITATNRDLERAVNEGRFRADLRYRLEVFVVEMPPLRARGDDIFLLTAYFASERARALGRPEPRLHPKVIEWLPKYPFPGNIRELRNMVDQAVLLARSDELTLEDFPVLSRLAAGWTPPEPEASTPEERPAPPPGGERAEAPSTGQRPRSSKGDAASQGSAADAAPHTGHAEPGSPYAAGGAPPTPAGTVDGDPAERGGLEAIRARAAAEERESLVTALQASGGNVAAAARQLGLSRYQMLRRLKKHQLR